MTKKKLLARVFQTEDEAEFEACCQSGRDLVAVLVKGSGLTLQIASDELCETILAGTSVTRWHKYGSPAPNICSYLDEYSSLLAELRQVCTAEEITVGQLGNVPVVGA